MLDHDTEADRPIVEMDWRKSTIKGRTVRAAGWIDRKDRLVDLAGGIADGDKDRPYEADEIAAGPGADPVREGDEDQDQRKGRTRGRL